MSKPEVEQVVSNFSDGLATHLKAGFVSIFDIVNYQRKCVASDVQSFFRMMEIWGFHSEESLEDLTKDIQPLSKYR